MAEDVKKLLEPKEKKVIKSSDYLSTGSTLLNMACSEKPRGGFIKGHYYFLVGDSNSGKTFLSLTCFAEACQNDNFKNYRLIFDNAEDGALMDFARFFGKKMSSRVVPPRVVEGKPTFSRTIQEFYDNLNAAKRAGDPCIYVLDSMDVLDTEERQVRASKKRAAKNKDDKGPGSFGTEKAKANSEGMREVMPFLRESGSILIVIGQTRDRIGFGAQFDPRTRAGGRSLTFYATLEMWSSQAGHITKLVKEKKRELGIYSKVRVKKNRIVGKDRTVTIPIYHSYGIDDLGSCVDYLVDEGRWKKPKGIIQATDFDFSGSRERLIAHIEENELHRELQNLVAETWREIERSCAITRKARYE